MYRMVYLGSPGDFTGSVCLAFTSDKVVPQDGCEIASIKEDMPASMTLSFSKATSRRILSDSNRIAITPV